MELLLLCIKIFLVRILDVSLGTVRTIVSVKGKSKSAAMIGFVEVFVWFLIVREALNTDVVSIWVAVAYAGGFATGTYIGGIISDRFIQGNLSVQVITSSKNMNLVNLLRDEGYGVSVMDIKGQDETEPKYMLFIGINKQRLMDLQSLIKKYDKKAFMVVNETKMVKNGYLK